MPIPFVVGSANCKWDGRAYTEAPEMKNHLSMEGSIGAGAHSSPRGILSVLESIRSGEATTEVLVLQSHC